MNKPTQAWIRAMTLTSSRQGQILPSVIGELAAKHGNQPALLDPTQALSYRHVAEQVNQWAHWAMRAGVNGQCVAVMLPNCAAYIPLWCGLTRAGCTVALVNINQTGDALQHSLVVVNACGVIAAEALTPGIPEGWTVWSWERLREEVGALPDDKPAIASPAADITALYIYTSGTTGLPKATRITHARILEWSCWFAGMTNASADDRLYNCLPLYHSVGGIVAVGSMLIAGGSVVIRERFSASRFWEDVSRSGCTLFQYIGELCRYLLAGPANAQERAHRLRLAVGNGLHGDVWEGFQNRFAIPEILEFYAATEGGLSLYNGEGKVGSVGRIPPFLRDRFAVELIRCDLETGEPLRGLNGFCERCESDEPGEAISRLGNGRRFDGYTDEVASTRKVLRDVFASGDSWFRTGDLMRRDGQGFFYFVDRLGDTFRWKGENVSTTEVGQLLRRCPGVLDAVSYGVAVAGQDGRAGMAAIVVDDGFDIDTLHAAVTATLPGYARPLYVRICQGLDLTGTFKLTKTALMREGIACADPVFAYDAVGYRPLNARCFTFLRTQSSRPTRNLIGGKNVDSASDDATAPRK